MPPTATAPALATKATDALAPLSFDEAEGIVEALVAVTGNVDDGGDVIVPGAFAVDRHPKIVWAHDLGEPVGKVLAMEEWLPADPRLPKDLLDAGYGALWVRAQFDLQDPDGARAFRKVLFHEDLGWSIGYRAVDPKPRKGGGRDLGKVVVYEASPVTFGMNREARTLVRKSLDLADPETGEEKVWPPMEGTLEARLDDVRDAVRAGYAGDEGTWVMVEGTTETEVVFSVEVEATGERSSWRAPYTIDDDGKISVGTATEVEIVTSAQVVEKAADLESPDLDEAAKALAELAGDLVEEAGETKAGRVLSARNREKISAALDALAAVLSAAEKADEDEKAGDPGTEPRTLVENADEIVQAAAEEAGEGEDPPEGQEDDEEGVETVSADQAADLVTVPF